MMTFLDINVLFFAHEGKGFGINENLLDTNLINIVLLLLLIFLTVGKDAMNNLSNRQKQILSDVQNADTRLNEAEKRLQEAKMQLNQIQIMIAEIDAEAKQTKTSLWKYEKNKSIKEIFDRIKAANTIFGYEKEQIYNQTFQDVVQLTLDDVFTYLSKQIQIDRTISLYTNQSSKIVENAINLLGEQRI